MAVAPIAIMPAPEYWMNGMAETAATAMHDQIGVCRLGATRDSCAENGSWLSLAMPKHRRIVAAMIDRQQTKIAADTTARYRVANGVEKLASITFAGLQPKPPFAVIAVCRLG